MGSIPIARSNVQMINAVHTILYAEDAAAACAFFRDVLGFENVDAGDGWLIFGLPPGELACHPAERAGTELFLMCRDVYATRRELEAKGVEFTQAVTEQAWGAITRFKVPGFGELGLYEPRHLSPLSDV